MTLHNEGTPADEAACKVSIFSPPPTPASGVPGFIPRFVWKRTGDFCRRKLAPELYSFDTPRYAIYQPDVLTVGRGYVSLKSGILSEVPDISEIRGKITGFSKKSRSRLIQNMSCIQDHLNYWIDLTFEDTCFLNFPNDLTMIKDASSLAMKKFKRFLDKEFPGVIGIWRREWEYRKSGLLQGCLFPHFHLLLSFPVADLSLSSINTILKKWVDCTNTLNPDKALSVALHLESHRPILSGEHAMKYVTKYVSKIQDFPQHARLYSLGRFWGKIGVFSFGHQMQIKLTYSQSAKLRRILRKIASLKKYSPDTDIFSSWWLLLSSKEVGRILEHLGIKADQFIDKHETSKPFFSSLNGRSSPHVAKPKRRVIFSQMNLD